MYNDTGIGEFDIHDTETKIPSKGKFHFGETV